MQRISLENRGREAKEQILKEIKLMQQLSHCYVVRYLESFVKGKTVCIVM
jgi:serine/threonine protein kinase